MFKSFLSDKSGNFAVIMGMLLLPLLLSVGLSVDYSRYLSAESHLQELADVASLALAGSREEDKEKLEVIANDFVAANIGTSKFDTVEIVDLKTENGQIDLDLKSTINTYFMGLANIDTLDVRASALAERAVTGSVEVALVLDNTWSMSEKDAGGVSRIDTLKKAAASLVAELMENSGAGVRIGLVPYADYVNVGTDNRGATWLSIPAEYDVAAVAETCVKKTVSERTCLESAPKYSCPTYIDGVLEPKMCNGACTKYSEWKDVEKKVCSGGVSAKSYRWYGCVGSRKTGTTRLNDGSPSVKYPGYIDTSKKCLNPVVQLTTDQDQLAKAIKDMIINVGGYKPYTYLQTGLIWGQNLLSPAEPFTNAAAYDLLKNEEPRKVVVFMTDGDNTLQFRASDGKHIAFSGTDETKATQLDKSNQDTAATCAYIKTNKIEIFTVAFMVDNDAAKTLLEGCATDADHYYDASDPDKLLAAFSGIAQSLSQVRLAR